MIAIAMITSPTPIYGLPGNTIIGHHSGEDALALFLCLVAGAALIRLLTRK